MYNGGCNGTDKRPPECLRAYSGEAIGANTTPDGESTVCAYNVEITVLYYYLYRIEYIRCSLTPISIIY